MSSTAPTKRSFFECRVCDYTMIMDDRMLPAEHGDACCPLCMSDTGQMNPMRRRPWMPGDIAEGVAVRITHQGDPEKPN